MDFRRFLEGPKDKDDFRRLLRSRDGNPDGKGGSRPGTAAGKLDSSGLSISGLQAAAAGWQDPPARPSMPVGSKFTAPQQQQTQRRPQRASQAAIPQPPPPQTAHDTLHNDVLGKVRQTFLDADDDGSGRLAPDEFVRAFLGILQTEDGGDEEALLKLFCRIDANSDGTIDWDEFSSYMLLESQGSASIRELESAINFLTPESPPVPDGLQHKDLVTHISHITLPNGADRYITCGKDGVVKVWNAKDMKHMRSINTGKSWVTCAKLLPLTNKLAVSSFNRSMKIFDLQTYEMCGQIPEIDYAPMAMDVWVPLRNKDVEMVVFGDGGGFVRLYEIRINPLEEKNSNDRYLDTPKWKFQHHSDWVTSVKYVEDMNCVIAGSLDKFVSMTDAEERVPLKVLEGHTKGVTTVDWSPIYKFVCSGGQDRRVFLWNPFSQKPLAQLLGHSSSVQQVMVNDRDNQIISLGSDKVVKVWDIRNHKCLQTIADREVYKLDDTLLAMTMDHKRKQLVTGNLQPKIWRQIVTTSGSAGHRQPVSKVIYNPLFNEAVSGDHGGTVSVWHVLTGKLRFRFYNAHGDLRITAMNFDAARRRLLTGCESGEVKVWNFSSGACLSKLKPRTSMEVTSVLAVRGALMRHFLVAGWDRKVTFYDDSGLHDVGPGRNLKGHKADVLDMVLMESFPTLMTACDDGEIWSWNIDSGAPRRIMSPDFRADTPPNEKAVEALCFLHGKQRHILAAVYADRYMRLWDVHTGALVTEVFTGHRIGETVLGLAVDSSDQRIATADSAGFVKMWDISGLTIQAGDSCDPDDVKEMCVWRAHKSQVSSVNWVETGSRFLLSSGHDKDVKIWSEEGVLVGVFGIGLWELSDPSTWHAQERQPLEELDAFDIEMSRHHAAGHTGRGLGKASERHLAKQYSFVSLLEEGSTAGQAAGSTGAGHARSTSPGVSGRSPMGSASSPHGGVGHAGGGGVLGAGVAAASQRFVGARGGLASPSGRPPLGASPHAHARPGTSPVVGSGSGGGLGTPARGGWGGAGPSPTLRGGRGGLLAPTGPSMRHGGGGGGAGDPRLMSMQRSPMPAEPPDQQSSDGPASLSAAELARVMAASNRQRLMRVGSAKRVERAMSAKQSQRFDPSAPHRLDSLAPRGAASDVASVEGSTMPEQDDEDDGDANDDDASLVESEASSKHDSDDDVPLALWMEEFEAARKGRQRTDASSSSAAAARAIFQPRGNQGLNFPLSAGRKDSVYHLVHVSEPKGLPDRPSTSYSTSRR